MNSANDTTLMQIIKMLIIKFSTGGFIRIRRTKQQRENDKKK